MKSSSTVFLQTVLLGALSLTGASGAEYDPLKAGPAGSPPVDFTVIDSNRAREIPIRVYLPESRNPAPVILFSHGLGGSRTNNGYLGRHWSSRGFAVVFLQHPGSDESVWKDQPPGRRMAAMHQAANAANFQLRVQDVPVVLDQLEKWNTDAGHTLARRLDLKRVGMSGHSFGAVTTQAVSGQSFPLNRNPTDPRIKAAVPMSPSTPRWRGDAAGAFGNVKIPWLLLTGTHDSSPIGGIQPADRLKVFPALPPGEKYELVLDKAEHSAFNERALPGETEKRNPNHHRAILAVTTAFWEAFLLDHADARQWLDGESVRSVLEPMDRWQKK